jgi:hypothetical protein
VNLEFGDFGVCLVNFGVWSNRMCGSGLDCLKVQNWGVLGLRNAVLAEKIEEFWVAEISWFVNVSWVVNLEFGDFGVCFGEFWGLV